MRKLTKAEVRYSKGMPTRHCGLCRYYNGDRTCKLVQGKIDPSMWCDQFKKKGGGK